MLDNTVVSENLQKYRKPMERMFYLFFVIIFIYDYLSSSMMFIPFQNMILKTILFLPIDLIEPVFELILNLRHLIIIPAVFTIIIEVKERNRKIILSLLLFAGWFYAMYWRESGDYAVFSPLLVIVACANRDMKKIIKLSLASGVFVIFLAFVLSRFGIIEDLTWNRPGSSFERHAFGMNYCTDLASHVMFLIFLYMFLKQGHLKWWDYVVIVGLSAVNVFFVDGQIALICVVMALAGCCFVSIYDKKGWEIPEKVICVWKWLLQSAFVVGAGVMFLLAITYKEDPQIWYNRYYSLENRIHTNYRLLKAIPFSWFGTSFVQVGSGGKSDYTGYYFWVDCSYTRVYAMHGIVAFIIFMALLTWVQIRLKKKKAYFGMFLMAVVAFDCMIEHHMIEVAFNTFLVLAFADMGGILQNAQKGEGKLAS